MTNISMTGSMKFIGWQFEDLSIYIIISMFILCLLFLKLIHSNVKCLYHMLPESFLLLIVGGIAGLVIKSILKNHINLDFKPVVFFNILLPPIILDASYVLATKTFGRVFMIILIFAVIATVFNFLIIGFSLGLVNRLKLFGFQEFEVSTKSILLFASLIVAVDPVAVLAIFADIGVELDLYFIVFGESLLNDAVTVALYDLMKEFSKMTMLRATDYVLGVVYFFVVSFGGILIGVFFGVVTCLITKIQSPFEVLILIILGYLSYLFALVFKWSGIISLITCGLIQAIYSFQNISQESMISLRKITSMWSSVSEGVIFLYLGERIGHLSNGWHTGFILSTLSLCLIARLLIVFGLSFVINCVNRKSGRIITVNEQLILAHGGLRGAVAFSLAMLIDKDVVGGQGNKNMFLCATILIVIFTVAIQGVTMKPLVKFLNIKIGEKKSQSLFLTANKSVILKTRSAIVDIVGEFEENAFIRWFMNFNNKILKPFLQSNTRTIEEQIIANFNTLCAAQNVIRISTRQQIPVDVISLSDIENPSVRIRVPHCSTMNPRPISTVSVCAHALTNEEFAGKISDTEKHDMISARDCNNPAVFLTYLKEIRRTRLITHSNPDSVHTESFALRSVELIQQDSVLCNTTL